MPTWHRIISVICLQRNFACIFTFGELLLHMVFSIDVGVLLFPYWFLQILYIKGSIIHISCKCFYYFIVCILFYLRVYN